MYERSASVLEKHISKTIIYLSELKENYEYYKKLINLLENYHHASEKEITYDKEYKLVLSIVEDIQKEQKDISKYNVELENKRNRLFSDNLKSAEEIESYVLEIEKALKANSNKLVELRSELIKNLKDLHGKKAKIDQVQEVLREENRKFRKSLREITSGYNAITDDQINWLENTINNYKKIEEDAIEIMMQNGSDERVPFNEAAITRGAIFGVDIARKQCETYIYIYKQTRKFMDEISENKVKLGIRKKIFFVADCKIKFLEAEKEYLSRFLDNERSTAVYSIEEHERLMKDAVEKFDLDIQKLNNLYILLNQEIREKVPVEEFNIMYDSTHYRDIEAMELKFQRETRKLGIEGVVSPYYWRREGIRCIYDTFTKIITPIEQERIEKNLIKIEDVERISELVKESSDFEDNNIENTNNKDLSNTIDEDDGDDYFRIFDDEDENEKLSTEQNVLEDNVNATIKSDYNDELGKIFDKNDSYKNLNSIYNDEKDAIKSNNYKTYNYDLKNVQYNDDYEENEEKDYENNNNVDYIEKYRQDANYEEKHIDENEIKNSYEEDYDNNVSTEIDYEQSNLEKENNESYESLYSDEEDYTNEYEDNETKNNYSENYYIEETNYNNVTNVEKDENIDEIEEQENDDEKIDLDESKNEKSKMEVIIGNYYKERLKKLLEQNNISNENKKLTDIQDNEEDEITDNEIGKHVYSPNIEDDENNQESIYNIEENIEEDIVEDSNEDEDDIENIKSNYNLPQTLYEDEEDDEVEEHDYVKESIGNIAYNNYEEEKQYYSIYDDTEKSDIEQDARRRKHL